MTERLKGLTVAFDHDIREDDAAAIVNAIKMIKGVLDVEPLVSTHEDWLIECRVRRELGEKLIAVLYPKAKP
jgi:hypothetical protein